MNGKEYIEKVKETESMDWLRIELRLLDRLGSRLDHAADGLCTEAGEFKDILKRFKYYGKKIDKTNLIEELGDLLWYVGIACDALNISLEEVMERNIAKLQERYKGKFSETRAINRDLVIERIILENDLNGISELSLVQDQYNEKMKDFETKMDNGEIPTLPSREDCLTVAKDILINSYSEICPVGCLLEVQLGQHFKSDHYAYSRGEFKEND